MPRIREYNFARFSKYCYQQIMRDQPAILAVDTETSGSSFYDEAFCVTMSWSDPDFRIRNAYFELGDVDFAEDKVKEILSLAKDVWGTELVFHNAKFDLQKLTWGDMMDWSEWQPHRIQDTEAIWHLLHPNDRKSLDVLTTKHLGLGQINVPTKTGKNAGKDRLVTKSKHELAQYLRDNGLKAEDGYHMLPRTLLAPYAMKDTEYTLRLYIKGAPKIVDGLLDAYRMEQEVSFALLHMEAAGMRLDMDYLTKTTSEFGVRVMESAAKIAELSGRPDINPNAQEQLKKALAARGYETESTDKHHLRRIDDDLAREILNYRYVSKIHSDKLRPMIDEQQDGIIHPWIRQHGAKTGRTSGGTAQPDG